MKKNDEYTVEVRQAANQGVGLLYVCMARSGKAYSVDRNQLEDFLKDQHELDDRVAGGIAEMASKGFVVRYYAEEGKVIAEYYLDDYTMRRSAMAAKQ